MRTILQIIFALFTAPVWGQHADSLAAAAQVDSLIKVSRDLTAKGAYEEALEVNAAAEKLALEKLGRESAAYGRCRFNHGRVLHIKRDYPNVEKWYLEAMEIQAKVLGDEHPDYVGSLNNLAVLYVNTDNHAKAEPLYLKVLAIREKTLGKEHPDYAGSLNNLAVLYMNTGNHAKAEPLYIEAKAIREKALGKEHPDYANSLNNLAKLYNDMGQYAKAEPLYIEAKAIQEKALGKEHPHYADILDNLAILYQDMGQYEKAETLCLESKAIREKALGRDHPNYASSLNNLASLYYLMGQNEKAEPLFIEAKAIREKVLGKEHPRYASSLNNLAILYDHMGQYEKAEPLFIEAKTIWEKTLGMEHPLYAQYLNNLAIMYRKVGKNEKAEPLHLEAKAIYEKTLGKEHPDYASSLDYLASVYNIMGQYEKAELLYIEAKAIYEKTLGKEHPDYANSLNNLAIIYTLMGQYEKAELLCIEAKAIKEKTLGKEHPEYANSLHNLAALYEKMGQYEKVEPLYIEANAIREKILGKEHPDYVRSLANLGLFYETIGQYEKTEPLHIKAKTIWEKTLGKEHPDYANSLHNLAMLYDHMGQYEKAEPFYIELSAVNRHLMEKAMLHLSDRELNNYLHKFSTSQNQTFSFTQSADSPKAISTCFDNSLFYKGFLLQTADRIKQLALSDTAATEKFNRLKVYQRRLAALYAKPIAERDSALVVQLETRANDLEKDLARTVAGYEQAKRKVTWKDVYAALKPGEAALEFVHYRYFGPKAIATDSTMYAALLLRHGSKQPRFIPLFEEKQLVQHLSKNRSAQNVALAYADRGASPLKTPDELSGLYDLIWRPLKKHLRHVKTVYFSPSGLLHRVNFDAIPVENRQILSDRFRLVRFSSTRFLVVPDLTKTGTTKSALLFGGISYDADSTTMSQVNARLDSVSIASRGELSFAYTDSTLRVGTWSALPFTEREVSGVEKTLKSAGFQSDTRRGFGATEEAFKTLGASGKPSPRVLHLATHGFFFPDPKKTSARFETSPTFDATEPVFKLSDHPMIRSGLILAGGNHAWATGKPLRPGMEDGILTAYEISQMNLSNTELVVLSACETGLGDIAGNEGVYGLQRAFKIAGAKYLIMSLWQVPDKQTSLLMTTFYKKWLEDKMEIPEAFRAAQKELREAGLDPYQWAGFVLVE